ncbi:peptide ABC transporter permease [uncultured Alsobacter sp.]|uniref:peptide ABC transporter permease n=1 Tax=uncultured Alsobacter sp. TaxID=1748258 RepID=UPI0025D8E5CC|nr:peptide ABC transporter permease [uncultured Alsobacter sp.]
MNRSIPTTADPATDAAGLLRRFGFAVLVILAPVAALVSRRGLVILIPIGIALLVLATFIESEGREPLGRARRALLAPAGLIAAFLVFWAGLSLMWTPFPAAASERLVNLAGISAVGMIAAAALPQRMRVSNLYLMPIGAGLAALVALFLEVRGVSFDTEPTTDTAILDRGLLMLVLVAPSAISWLASKDRYVACFALVAVVTAALVYGGAWPALGAFAIGAVVYAIVTLNAAAGRWVALILIPGLVLAAPALPFLLRPVSKVTFGITHPKVETIRTWSRIVTDDPARLITGHGLDTALRAKLAGLVPNQAPSGILFEVWFELGFLGAIALALLLAKAVNGASRLQGGAAPGAMMTLAVAFSLAVLGQGAAQAWWLIGLALAAILAVAVDRGQYRTTRPRSSGPAR